MEDKQRKRNEQKTGDSHEKAKKNKTKAKTSFFPLPSFLHCMRISLPC